MVIYISHPFQNDPENKKSVEKIIIELVENFPNDTFISPIHAFGYLWDYTTYQQGLDMCLELLNRCDMMIVYGDYPASKGCMAEVAFCLENYLPVVTENGLLTLLSRGKSLEDICDILSYK